MSSFLSALQDQDQKADHGWSQANLFSSVATNQMFTSNTPDSQSIGSLEGWSEGGVVVEEVVQEDFITSQNSSEYVFGSNTSQQLQTFADASGGSQLSDSDVNHMEVSTSGCQTGGEPISQVIGSFSADKTFTTSDGRVVKPDTVLTSEGAYSTFNVTVSPDGTLLHAATDNNVVTSEEYIYLNANNALNINNSIGLSPNTNVVMATNQVSNGVLTQNSNIAMATNTGNNVLLSPYTSIAFTGRTNSGNIAVQTPNTSVAMTTNHISGETILSQTTTMQSPVKTSDVIIIPKVSPGRDSRQIVTLSNEEIQKYLKGNKQLFSAQKSYKFIAPSQSGQIRTEVQGQGNPYVINNMQQPSNAPKLTSLLTGSIEGNSQMKLPITSPANLSAVTVSQNQGGNIVTQNQSLVTQNQVGNITQNQAGNIVTQKQVGNIVNQTTVYGNSKDGLVKLVNPQPQMIVRSGKNLIVNLDANKIGGIKNQSAIVSEHSQSANTIQGQYVTTLTAKEVEMFAGKNILKENSNVLTGANSQAVLAAISSGIQHHQSNTTASSSPNVTYIITTSTPNKNYVTTSTPSKNTIVVNNTRGRGRGSRGRCTRGRGIGIPAQGMIKPQYIIVQKGESQTSVKTTPNILTVKSNPSGVQAPTLTQTAKKEDFIDLITSPGRTSNSENEGTNNNSIQNEENCINKKFVRCKDGGELVAGTTYLVSGPNNEPKKMLFNGENFVTPPGELSSPDMAPDGSMIGGGRKAKPLKGNAIGLTMTRENKLVITESRSTDNLLPNGRTWKYTEPPHGSNLARPPLHPTQEKESESLQQDSSSQSSDASVGTDPKNQDQISNKYFALCKYCGGYSPNLTRCSRCSRIFSEDLKLIPQNNEEKSKPLYIEKNKFYSNKISEQASVYGGYTVKHLENETITTGRTIKASGKQYKLVHSRRVHAPQEPVTVTISSDEEEEETETNESEPTPSKSKEESTPVNSEPDELSELVNVIPLKRSSSPTFEKGSRISRMENKDGQPVRKVRRKSISESVFPIRTVSTTTTVIDNKAGTVESTADQIEMDCRSARVGSLKGTPIEPVIISTELVELYMEGEDATYRIRINPDDILQCLFGKKCNIVFLQTTIEAGVYVRKAIGMHQYVEGKPWFAPGGADMKQFYITFFLTDAYKIDTEKLNNIFKSYKNSKKSEFLVELDYPSSQALLVKTAPVISNKTSEAALQRMSQDQNKTPEVNSESRATTPADDTESTEMERSPSPPRILFSGPIEKLITYPPPPATGGITITNEDLFCLTDGEFLNDVIIDFYLKYLVNEKLSEEDRKRTHVFSSFFFKRLTQRINRHTFDSHHDAENMSIAEKRHARVKKWTKHVDLFDKDFIIVPINERSHWFLAMICFPGLMVNRTVKYLAKPKVETIKTEPASDKSEEVEKEATESQENQTENSENDNKEGEKLAKEESPVDKEQNNKEEEPMDTDSNSNNENESQEPRGRLLTEEELQDPEIAKKAMPGLQQPCIIVMDSLAGQSRQRIINVLKDYLQVEWNSKKSKTGSIKERFKGAIPKVPQQTNYSDCGVYVLQYVDSFFEDPIFNFVFPLKNLGNWFTEERASKKRDEIKDLVMKLKEKYDSQKKKKS